MPGLDRAEVTEGLSGGETVVAARLDRVAEGARVEPERAEEAPPERAEAATPPLTSTCPTFCAR